MKLTLLRGHSHPRPDDVLALLLLMVIVVTLIGTVLVVWHAPSLFHIDWGPAFFQG
jgi:hypothetical protein